MASDSEDDDSAVMNDAAASSAIDTSMCRNDDPDTMRILLSTDNHLGYAERDPIRGNDSFAAFEEVLYTAKRFNCDAVLLSGDLFHDNRPSRRCLHKTMGILKRYCMGPDPVRIEMLSDAASQFRSATTVNYQDPNYAVQLPLFSIHGNHDDPSRDQGGGELLAALDLLAVSNLVNYFGRQDEVDKVDIAPVLLKKGNTKVALYGLGSLRDERLNRMWERQKVRFSRPEDDTVAAAGDDEDDDNEDGFFNIFTLHQNRDLGRGSKNCVQESMIPEWMDLVVWGHEHECLIEFFESVVGTFRITQPGSSVATSLVSGEAARKKIGILDINGKNFRLHPVPLTQVRSFVTTEISLREHRAELDPEDPKIDTKVTAVLEEEVQLMVANAREKMKEILVDARAAGSDAGEKDCSIKFKLQSPDQVLVRIRVEHNGFSTLNNQRFGARFVGEVANPSDMLLFHRKKDPKLASTIKKKGVQPIAPEELERTNMEDLVREQLDNPEGKLKLLGEKELSEALEDYVDKGQTGAISDIAADILNQKQKILVKSRTEDEDEAVPQESQALDMLDHEAFQDEVSMDVEKEAPKRAKKAPEKRKASNMLSKDGKENEIDLDDDDDDDDDDFQQPSLPKRATEQTNSSRAVSQSSKRKADRRKQLDDSSVEDMYEEPASKARSKPAERPKRGGGKRKVYDLAGSDDDFDDDDDAVVDDDDDDDVLVVEEAPSKRKTKASSTGKKKAAPARRATTTSGTARKVKESKVNRRKQLDDSDDDDVEYLGESANLEADWGSAATKSQRNQWP